MLRLAHRVWGIVPSNLYIRRDCPSPEITQGASFYKYTLYFDKVKESHRQLGSADRPLVLPSIPDHRSGLVPIDTPSQSLRPAGRVVLVPSAETAHGSLRLDSRAPAAGPVLSLLLSSPLSCRRCSLVVAPFAAHVAAPVVAAAPDADPIAAPVAASIADPVAVPAADSFAAFPLRVPGNPISPWPAPNPF